MQTSSQLSDGSLQSTDPSRLSDEYTNYISPVEDADKPTSKIPPQIPQGATALLKKSEEDQKEIDARIQREKERREAKEKADAKEDRRVRNTYNQSIKDFHQDYQEKYRKGANKYSTSDPYRDQSFVQAENLIKAESAYNQIKPRSLPPFNQLPPTIAEAVANFYAILKGAAQISLELSNNFGLPGMLLGLVITMILENNPANEPINPIKRTLLSEKEMQKQEERIKNPVPEITKRLALAPQYLYSLEKNKLEAFKLLGLENKGLESKIKETEKENKDKSSWLPFIVRKIGDTPFPNEVDKILSDLTFEKRKELFKTADMNMLNDAKFSMTRNRLQDVISASDQATYNAKFALLSADEKKILLGTCNIKTLENLKIAQTEGQIKEKFDKEPEFKKFIQTSAMNRYNKDINIFGPNGCVTDVGVKNALNGSPSVEGFEKLSTAEKDKALKNMHQSGATLTNENGITVDISTAPDMIDTLTHELTHANFQTLPHKIKQEFIHPVEALESRMDKKISEKVKDSFPNFNFQPTPDAEGVKENLKSMGVVADDKMLLELNNILNNSKHTLQMGDGRTMKNSIPNIENEFLKLVIAVKYFNNLGKFPVSKELNAKIEEFLSQGENRELVDNFLFIYSLPQLETGHYDFNDRFKKMEECVPRINERQNQLLALKALQEEEAVRASSSRFTDKVVGTLTGNKDKKGIAEMDGKTTPEILSGIIQKIGTIGGSTFLSQIPLKERAGFSLGSGHQHSTEHEGHSHNQSQISKPFFKNENDVKPVLSPEITQERVKHAPKPNINNHQHQQPVMAH